MTTKIMYWTIITEDVPEAVEDTAILYLQKLMDERGLDEDTIESRCYATQQLADTNVQVVSLRLSYQHEDPNGAVGIVLPMLRYLMEKYSGLAFAFDGMKFHDIGRGPL